MRLLLDTHIWLWSLLEPKNLSRRVSQALESPSNELWLSPVSTWEFFLLARKKRIVLDLSELGRMDSSGLGAIVAIYVSAKAAGCELELINLNKQIRELLRLTNLLSVFAECGQQGIRMQ